MNVSWSRLLTASMVLFLAMSLLGCSSERREQQRQLALRTEHPILRALDRRDRNTVYVALLALQKNGFSFPEKVRFDAPYAEARRDIEAIRGEVARCPEDTLLMLDRSLSEEFPLYTPRWLGSYWP